MSQTNPLLSDGLPEFDRILPEHAVPAIRLRLDEYGAVLDRITGHAGEPDYDSVVVAEILADDALARAWSTVGHLHAVINSPEWRAAYSECLDLLTRFYTARGQNRALFGAWEMLGKRPDYADQPSALRRLIEHELLDFSLAGVALEEADRERFAATSLRLSELGNRFGNHVLDSTEAYSEAFTDVSALAGLPPTELELLAGNARAAGVEGYRADLSHPCYRAIITYADDRELRRRYYTAHAARASDQGPQAPQFNNGPIIEEMLQLRSEQACLLGYPDHAAMRLEKRMAENAAEVESFLRDLAERARPAAEAQYSELCRFAAGLGGPATLAAWDIPYYSEKLREHRLGLNQEKLRPWFELEQVLGSLFSLAESLFGVRFERSENVPTWHPDVRYYRMTRPGSDEVPAVYMDLFSRPRKQGGAWMDVCRARLGVGGPARPPVAYLTCNFAPPAQGRPSLLTHEEVRTLFHEFGHCLHHLLTQVDWPPVGGISGVEWDAVELPSQLFESWIWEREFLDRTARHVQSGEPLPADMVHALGEDRRFLGALALLRQVEFALVDLAIHTKPDPDIVSIMREIHDQVGVTPLPGFNRYLNSFTHLFDGGYAAGYYSYLWAERLARDAWSVFHEEGLFSRSAGTRLAEEILGVGGSRPMRESWLAFRGREAALEPLLETYGVAA